MLKIRRINELRYERMKKYKYFIELTDVDLLDMHRNGCIPLAEVYDAVTRRRSITIKSVSGTRSSTAPWPKTSAGKSAPRSTPRCTTG